MIVAVQHLQPMPGGSQSHLMACSDGKLWVVKFGNNPQRPALLANELIVSRIAKCIGLSVPQIEFVYISQSLIKRSPDMRMKLPSGKTTSCATGIQLGSRFVGDAQSKLWVSSLPKTQMLELTNVAQFAGILALDCWIQNEDQRQAVFSCSRKGKKQAFFIDHGLSLSFTNHKLSGAKRLSCYSRTADYSGVCCLNSFEPWLSRIEHFTLAKLIRTADGMPGAWYPGGAEALALMFGNLLTRKSSVRNSISLSLEYEKEIFTGRSNCHQDGCSSDSRFRPSLLQPSGHL